jgi:hypothetical protein
VTPAPVASPPPAPPKLPPRKPAIPREREAINLIRSCDRTTVTRLANQAMGLLMVPLAAAAISENPDKRTALIMAELFGEDGGLTDEARHTCHTIRHISGVYPSTPAVRNIAIRLAAITAFNKLGD